MKPNTEPTIINNNEMHNCNVFTAPIYGATFPLPGAHVTINQYSDSKTQATQTTQGCSENAQDRLARKKEAIEDMCHKLNNLEPDMIGPDASGKTIPYATLSLLLHKCLGMHTVGPKPEFKDIQEAIWTILIDKREKCQKDPRDLYFPQTFLNMMAYFRVKDIFTAKPMQLFNIWYPNADKNLAKNLDRPIPCNAFPEGTEQMLDFYIEQVLV